MMKDCLLLSLFLYKNKDEGSVRRAVSAVVAVVVVVEVNNVLQLFSFPFTNHITKRVKLIFLHETNYGFSCYDVCVCVQ